jgi:hypothetical protein
MAVTTHSITFKDVMPCSLVAKFRKHVLPPLCFLLALLFDYENGLYTFTRNVRKHAPDNTASQRRQ